MLTQKWSSRLREKVAVEWLPHPSDPSQPIHNLKNLSIRAIPLSSTSHSPSFPTPRQDWEWRDVDLKLDSLSADQLAGWRRTVLADMFKKDGNLSGQAPGANTNPTPGANTNDTSPANDIIPVSEGSGTSTKIINPPLPPNSADADGHIPKPIRQYHPARMHIPQPIPHPSSDATTSTTNDPDLRYAYILQAPPVRGKFDAKKAVALGVRDDQRGRLIETGSVEVVDETAEGGKRLVKAEDVLGKTKDGGAFIMVDITASHLPRLLEDPAFKEYQSVDGQDQPGKKAGLVVHRISDEVMRDERYQAWAKAFGKDTPVSSMVSTESQAVIRALILLSGGIPAPGSQHRPMDRQRDVHLERQEPAQTQHTGQQVVQTSRGRRIKRRDYRWTSRAVHRGQAVPLYPDLPTQSTDYRRVTQGRPRVPGAGRTGACQGGDSERDARVCSVGQGGFGEDYACGRGHEWRG